MEATNTTTEAARLRAEAAQHEQDREDSFQRCDTDGFLSQWASGVMAQVKRIEANIVERGGVAEFPALFTTDGDLVPAVLRSGQYGPYWMVIDPETRRATGEFVNAFPVRRSTLVRKGYLEGSVLAPAKADCVGTHAVNVQAQAVRTDGGWSADVEVVCRDRWEDES